MRQRFELIGTTPLALAFGIAPGGALYLPPSVVLGSLKHALGEDAPPMRVISSTLILSQPTPHAAQLCDVDIDTLRQWRCRLVIQTGASIEDVANALRKAGNRGIGRLIHGVRSGRFRVKSYKVESNWSHRRS
jgi:hypothetical protein